jgi:hypothetical protein
MVQTSHREPITFQEGSTFLKNPRGLSRPLGIMVADLSRPLSHTTDFALRYGAGRRREDEVPLVDRVGVR